MPYQYENRMVNDMEWERPIPTDRQRRLAFYAEEYGCDDEYERFEDEDNE